MKNRYSNSCCNHNIPTHFCRPDDLWLQVELTSADGANTSELVFALKFHVYGHPECVIVKKEQLIQAGGNHYALLNEKDFAPGWLFCEANILEAVNDNPNVRKPVKVCCNTGILLSGCGCDGHAPSVDACEDKGYTMKITRVESLPEEPGKTNHECEITSEPCFDEYFSLPELTADRAIHDENGNRIIDYYVSRKAVAAYIKSVYNQNFIANPPYIMQGYITPDMLSEAVKQMLAEAGATVTNLPDEEDLTTVHGVLKFANKRYNPATCSGMGRQYLRKNMVNGVNVLTQDMMQEPNTAYIIQYDYNLRGETLNIPEGCVLKFEDGSISNGILATATETLVKGQPIFTSCELQGVFQRIEDGTLLTKVIFI